MKYPLIIKFSLAFLLFIIPFTMWGQYYDSVHKVYLYKFFTPQNKNYHPLIKKQFHNDSNQPPIFKCIIKNLKGNPISGTPILLTSLTKNDTFTIFTNSVGIAESQLSVDSFSIEIQDSIYQWLTLPTLTFLKGDRKNFEINLIIEVGPVITLYGSKKLLNRRKFYRIHEKLENDWEKRIRELNHLDE